MTNRLLEGVEQPHLKKEPPQFDVGDTVDVHTRIIEGDKERVQVFSGTVIMRKGKGINETFTVRRIVNNEGVERIFPVHSPFVAKVVVRRGGRTRRAKLFYLRERVGKAVRLTEAKRKDKRDEAQTGQAESAGVPASKSKAKNKEETPELAASAT
jgi:large subunit ribosomal protein L19